MHILAKMTFQRPDLDLVALTPLLVFGALMVIALLFELKPEEQGHGPEAPPATRPMASVAAALGLGLLIAGYLAYGNETSTSTFNGMLANDPFSRWAGLIIAGCGLMAVLAGPEELQRKRNQHGGEFVALILGACMGMLLMASALNTMVIFLGLELFSIALYLLCIFFPDRPASQESGMKYFLLSSAASAIMLYGMALLYGATGTTWLVEMSRVSNGPISALGVAGGVLVLVGLLFKLAAFPFHLWSPDVYQGAPTTVTAFMSVSTKVAAIVALWRIFLLTNPELGDDLRFVMMAVAVASMLIGNMAAIAQTSVKRMLAFSGVGNAGYLLIAPSAGYGMESAMLFFLTTYMFANLGAFLSVAVIEGLLDREPTRADVRGLYKTHPGLAAVFGLSLISLAGLPPAGGFLGKFFLLGRALGSEAYLIEFVVAVAVFCSVLGVAYYLGTAISLFDGREVSAVEKAVTPPPADPALEPPTSMTTVALVLCAAGILILGVVPAPFLDWLALSSSR